jgi:hypothetical protein
MKIEASGRSALILAAGLWVVFAGPSQAAGTNGTSANSTAAAPTTPDKNAKHASRHWKKYAHHKSRDAPKSSTDKKAAATDDATANGDTSSALPSSGMPSSVANANARATAPDSPTGDAAQAMSQRANNMLQAAPDNPSDAQPAETQVVAADQLNDIDRALREANPPAESNQPPTTLAMASAEAPVVAGSAASSSDSTWDQTSLIGKIFIGFGALLTFASAARMFIA